MIIAENQRVELQGNPLIDLVEPSPDPGSDFEQKLTLAMKRFSLDEYFCLDDLSDNQ